MRSAEIEEWAHRIIDRVEKRQPVEDAQVELKSGWVAADEAARRIAGLANANSPEPVMWLVGVDERGARVWVRQPQPIPHLGGKA